MWGSGFRAQGSGFRVQVLGFREGTGARGLTRLANENFYTNAFNIASIIVQSFSWQENKSGINSLGCGSEAGSYLRLIDLCITQLQA